MNNYSQQISLKDTVVIISKLAGVSCIYSG